MQTTEDAVIKQLDELTDGETWRIVDRYKIHRYRTDGEGQDVEVEITYRPGVGYMVVATDAKRKLHASGNPDEDLAVTLQIAHWFELDAPART